jgi:hypothetical protein
MLNLKPCESHEQQLCRAEFPANPEIVAAKRRHVLPIRVDAPRVVAQSASPLVPSPFAQRAPPPAVPLIIYTSSCR